MEEIKQDELKKEFEERFCKGKLNEFHPDISPYDIWAWIASKINEAKIEESLMWRKHLNPYQMPQETTNIRAVFCARMIGLIDEHIEQLKGEK